MINVVITVIKISLRQLLYTPFKKEIKDFFLVQDYLFLFIFVKSVHYFHEEVLLKKLAGVSIQIGQC